MRIFYGFGDNHPFGPVRLQVFWKALAESGPEACVWGNLPIPPARAAIEHFHTYAYVDEVIERSRNGAEKTFHRPKP